MKKCSLYSGLKSRICNTMQTKILSKKYVSVFAFNIFIWTAQSFSILDMYL